MKRLQSVLKQELMLVLEHSACHLGWLRLDRVYRLVVRLQDKIDPNWVG